MRGQLLTVEQNQAWSIFLAQYLAHSTFPGASRLSYALIGGLSISQALLSTPLVNLFFARFGTRPTLLLGTLLVFAALLGASYASAIWHLFLSQGVAFGWGMGFLYIPASTILPRWFSTRRSLAVGLATSGAGLGGLAYNLAAGHLVETVGLQWTYRVLALCSLGANLLSSLLLRDRPRAVSGRSAEKVKAFDFRELGRVEVVLVGFWGTVTELGYITLLYSLPSYAAAKGLSTRQGSLVSALLNLGLGVGRPLIGYYSDAFGRINVATAMTALCGLLCLGLWIPADSFPALLAFALLAGTVCGTFWGTMGPVTAEVVGLQRLNASFGVIFLALVWPTTFAEPIALRLVDTSGYLSAKIFVGVMFLLGAGSVWLLRSWKVTQIERKRAVEAGCEEGIGFWFSPRKLFVGGKI